MNLTIIVVSAMNIITIIIMDVNINWLIIIVIIYEMFYDVEVINSLSKGEKNEGANKKI